ncbi:MAG: hypothetical protein LBF77_11655 [Spirochaetaceae bacterium]|jgi:hypothetical protein|nr:hypothetical protein [Spirochaetaceae bacterium]
MKFDKIKTSDKQKRMHNMRRKAIVASRMLGIATLFGACPNPTTEYVDKPYWSEDEQPKPAWNKVLRFTVSVDQTMKDKFIAAYDTLDKAYVIELKYDYGGFPKTSVFGKATLILVEKAGLWPETTRTEQDNRLIWSFGTLFRILSPALHRKPPFCPIIVLFSRRLSAFVNKNRCQSGYGDNSRGY